MKGRVEKFGANAATEKRIKLIESRLEENENLDEEGN